MQPATRRLPGIQPLDMADWLVMDEAFGPQIALRDRLLKDRREEVFATMGGEEAAAEEADLCPVCAAPIMERTRVLAACRHEFCFGCISREVDARGRCPLDRLRLDRSMLERIDT